MSTKNSISWLTIKGFKSIKNLDRFGLDQLNVLIGANGVGKSNFVSYFRMLSEMAELRLQNWTTNQGSGHKEAKLKEKYKSASKGSEADYCYSSIASWKVFHFHDTSDTTGVKRLGSLHDNEYLRPDASNLAAYLYRLSEEHPEVLDQIRETIRLVIPFFDDFVLKPRKLKSGEEQIRLLWRQKDSDYSLWPSQLSDGSIRFICLVTALLRLRLIHATLMNATLMNATLMNATMYFKNNL